MTIESTRPSTLAHHGAVLSLPSARPDTDTPEFERVVSGKLVTVSGRVDAGSVADLRQFLREAIDEGVGELEVNVSGLELGDATGLGALLGAHRHAVRSGRSMLLTNPRPRLLRLLCATRLVRVLRVREDMPA